MNSLHIDNIGATADEIERFRAGSLAGRGSDDEEEEDLMPPPEEKKVRYYNPNNPHSLYCGICVC